MIWHKLLKPDKTVDGARYQRQLTNFNNAIDQDRPEYADRRDKVFL